VSKIAHSYATLGLQAYLEQYFEGAVEYSVRGKQANRHQRRIPMELILIIVLLVLLFGGGGYWGRSRGHW
jgi:hypothetical protein